MEDSNLDYDNPIYTPPDFKPKKTRSKKPFLIVVGILLLIALGLGGYKLLSKNPNKPASNQTSAAETKTVPQDVPDSAGSQKYENSSLGTTLTYPLSWVATEAAAKDSVRLESPEFSYQTSAGTTVTGNFRIYIRKGSRDNDGKYIGRGVAIQPSEKLVYTKPAVGQRTDTYLSLFGLDAPDNFAFFMIAGNFNLKKGETLGPTYGKEADTFIIAGGFSAKSLTDDLATSSVPISLLQSSNAYKQAVEILKSLQLQ